MSPGMVTAPEVPAVSEEKWGPRFACSGVQVSRGPRWVHRCASAVRRADVTCDSGHAKEDLMVYTNNQTVLLSLPPLAGCGYVQGVGVRGLR
jgi:hypothetical protein